MSHFSIFALARNALSYHENWQKQWRSPEPKSCYDAIIVGGGGHGLATAYYLAKEHGMRNIAVVERGWLGGGNTARNTTIVRSNYLWDDATHLYEKALQLWEGLSQDLNYNTMFSQRGVMNVGHSLQDMRDIERRVNANRLNGVDGVVLTPQQIKAMVPIMNTSASLRYPVMGASFQPRAGVARHDAIAWGFARAADRLGVDIIQNCDVRDFEWSGERITGVHTSRGTISAGKVGMAVAGNTSPLAQKAGLQLPIDSHVLQAYVTESIKPIVNHVVVWSASYFYFSQSDKGGLVFGGHIDRYNSYAQRGNLANVSEVTQALVSAMPSAARLRVLRHWGGIMDMTPDGSPIITKTPVDGLYLNAGWCYGGFKATPASGWCFAHTIANDAPHAYNAGFTLDRFAQGRYIDEAGTGPYNHLQ